MATLFGTDGIRNAVGTTPLTLDILPRLGQAIGRWAQEKYGDGALFLLAHDTRQSCSWVKATLKAGLLLYPVTIHDAQILPTPAVFHLMKENDAYVCGLIISASHNPYGDNGIKIIDAQLHKLSYKDELALSQLTVSPQMPLEYTYLGTDTVLHKAQKLYCTRIMNLCKPYFLRGYKIVLDVAYGAAYRVAPTIFRALGAQVIVINNKPTGYNINDNCGTLHSQTLQKAVIKHQALVGFAFDGDADRVIAVNRQGQIKDGDDILALLSNHPDYAHSPAIVGTVMTNQGLQIYLNSNSKQLIRVPVGDKHIAQALEHHGIVVGGEQSGHILLNNIINTGDGILVALKLLEAAQYTGNWDMVTFTKFPQLLLTIPVKVKKDLQEPPLAHIIAENSCLLPAGRVLVRYSGTEHSLRIMVEDQDTELVKKIAYKLAYSLQSYLS
jgi:phosphoglucosamine mutase